MEENRNETAAAGADDGRSHVKQRIDERLIYIIPSVVAMCFALASMLFYFGNRFVDMRNTCYYLYLDASSADEQEFLKSLHDIIKTTTITGYTVQRNLQGGYYDKEKDQVFTENNSYMLILMDVSQEDIKRLAQGVLQKFNQNEILIEEVTMNSYFLSKGERQRSWREMLKGN